MDGTFVDDFLSLVQLKIVILPFCLFVLRFDSNLITRCFIFTRGFLVNRGLGIHGTRPAMRGFKSSHLPAEMP